MQKFTGKFLLKSALWPYGRLGRAYFLLFISIAFLLVLSGLGLLDITVASTWASVSLQVAGWLSLLLGGMLAWIASGKRLHDMNRSGWYGVFILMPFVNMLFCLYLLCVPSRRFIATVYCHPSRRLQLEWNRAVSKLKLSLPTFKQIDFSKDVNIVDSSGKTTAIKKSVWVQKVVPEQLRKYWDNADRLENVIIFSLEQHIIWDGLWLLAKRYYDIEQQFLRYYLPALVMLACDDALGAERLSREYLRQDQSSAELHYTLARALTAQGRYQAAADQVALAVRLAPNHVDLLRLYLADVAEQAPEYRERLLALAEIEDSWLPQLYLMELSLETDVFAVKRYIDHALRFRSVENNVLEYIAVLLVKNKRYKDVFRWIYPLYDPQVDGAYAGQVLLKACVDSEETKHGYALLHRLYLLNRPALSPVLKYYADDLDAISRAKTPALTEIESVTLLHYSHPIWFYGLKDPSWLFDDTVVRFNYITLVPLSVIRDDSIEGEVRGESASGQMSRGLMLHVASEVYLRSYMHVDVLLPVAEDCVPVVYNQALDFKALENFDESMSRYVLTGDIQLQKDLITLRYVLWDMQQQDIIAEVIESGEPEAVDEIVQKAQEKVLPMLAENCQLQWHTACPFYHEVAEGEYAFQSLVMEQILNLHLASVRDSAVPLLWGERTIIDNCFDYADMCKSKTLGLLIVLSGLRFLKETRPEIVDEYQAKILALYEKAAKAEETARLLKPALLLLYPALKQELTPMPVPVMQNKRYDEWLQRILVCK